MTRIVAAVLIALAAASLAPRADQPDEWPYYGHDAGGARHSPLADINRSNVAQLKVAWVFHTGDVRDEGGNRRTGFESTPIVVDGTLFVTTASEPHHCARPRNRGAALGLRSEDRSVARIRRRPHQPRRGDVARQLE
jgi:glucose dehydrogenase